MKRAVSYNLNTSHVNVKFKAGNRKRDDGLPFKYISC